MTRVHRNSAAVRGRAHDGPRRRAAPRTPTELALRLQRTVGNAATGRLLARAPAGALANRRHRGTAFVRGEGEHESGVDANDVVQGSLNDCYFLSPLMAAARINPNWIRRMIRGPRSTRDGVRIFDVDLYVSSGTGKPQLRTLEVDDQFVTRSDGSLAFARYGDMGAGGPELWVMLFEKAWAMLRDGYDKAEWRPATEGLMAVTGHEAKFLRILDFISDEMILRTISDCLRDGKPVTIQTKTELGAGELGDEDVVANGWTFVRQHVYNVAAVDKGRRTLDIMNPHGRNHLRGFPLAKVRKFFDSYAMSGGSVR